MKNKLSPALLSLTQVINQISADTIDEVTTQSLKDMLDLTNFGSIKDVIQNKLNEVKTFIKPVSNPIPTPSPVTMTDFFHEMERKIESIVDIRKSSEVDLDHSPQFEYENPYDYRTAFNEEAWRKLTK
jgi:hypothetical protein